MKRSLAVLTMLGGLVACSHAGSAPLTPVSAGPTTHAPPAGAPAPAPPAVVAIRQAPDSAPQTTNPFNQIRSAAEPSALPDSMKEQAFLDSLHLLTADSAHRAAAPAAPMAPPVAPEAVRREAVSMFGRPEGTVATATWDIDVTSYAAHDRVQFWVDFFSGRARWHMERYLERLGRYDSIIRGELAAAGMPRDMIYLAMIESGFNQNARSRVGAVGLWQFMPSTARRYGLTVDAWVDERRDPFIATGAAIRFLSELNSHFGSWYLAAAAYDAGPGKIQKGLDRGDYSSLSGNDAYFAMAEGHFLRRETRDYVPKLIAAALIAKDPTHYGFTDLERWAPLRYDSINVDYSVGLNVVARLSGASRDDIEEMNPAFFRGVTPPVRTSWVRIPHGTHDSVAARLAVLPAKDRVSFVAHIVSRGETLSKIAVQYGVRIDDIKAANRLHSNRLASGQRLSIPTSGSRSWSRGASRYRLEDPVRVRRGPAVRGQRRPVPARVAYAPAAGRRVHVVRRGESLWAIASQYHTTTAALMRANGLNARSRIRPGQTMRIPN
jgi:membrane-bound lytic murein transglycosylase D